MEKTPLWINQFSRPDSLITSKSPNTETDVAIVGSGYTGLCAARVLKKNGASVTVLDRNTIGWGASSRNGGMATPGLKQGIQKIYKMYGSELAHEFWNSSVDAIDLIDAIVNEHSIDCDWERNGHASLATKPSHAPRLKEYGSWLEKEFGHSQRYIPKNQIRDEIGSDAYYGALTDDISGGLHPSKYVFGLATAVANLGVQLCENTEVTKIEKNDSNNFRLISSKGDIIAKKIIIATNGYTNRLVPKLKPLIFPVGSYIVVTEPLTKELQNIISPKKRMYYDSKWFLNYFRLTPDGRMLWGGRNDLSTDLDLDESAIILSKELYTIFPDLAGIPITNTWTGKLGITFDLMPHIGQTNGIYYAFGYGGHGLSIATYLGTEIGLLLSGKKDRSPFMEISHQTMFFYRDKPWFIPFAARYFRFLDWIS
ncbi:MAG: FAD-dependent oxidoreductase [Candidatus Marinimicrobia bacterium]|nr:FAD-dependent oxidoreductase [Candidatus Neomarinimicrobiota bacterium]